MANLRITKTVVEELGEFIADLTDGVIALEAPQNDGSGLKYKIAGETRWFKGKSATLMTASFFAGAIGSYLARLSPDVAPDDALAAALRAVVDRRDPEAWDAGEERGELVWRTTRCWKHSGQDHRTQEQRDAGVDVLSVMPRSTGGLCTGHAYELKVAGGRTCAWIDQAQTVGKHGYVPSLVTEDQPGHAPLVGQGEHASPWFWGQTAVEARAECARYNARRHISVRAQLEIVNSSMFALLGQRGARS